MRQVQNRTNRVMTERLMLLKMDHPGIAGDLCVANRVTFLSASGSNCQALRVAFPRVLLLWLAVPKGKFVMFQVRMHFAFQDGSGIADNLVLLVFSAQICLLGRYPNKAGIGFQVSALADFGPLNFNFSVPSSVSTQSPNLQPHSILRSAPTLNMG